VAKLLAAGAKIDVVDRVRLTRVGEGRGAERSFPSHLLLSCAFLARFIWGFSFLVQGTDLMLATHRRGKGKLRQNLKRIFLCHLHLDGKTSQNLLSLALLLCEAAPLCLCDTEGRRGAGGGARTCAVRGGAYLSAVARRRVDSPRCMRLRIEVTRPWWSSFWGRGRRRTRRSRRGGGGGE